MINSDHAASYRDHQELRLDPQVSKSRSLSGGGVIHRLDRGEGPVDATDVKTQKHSARQNRRCPIAKELVHLLLLRCGSRQE